MFPNQRLAMIALSSIAAVSLASACAVEAPDEVVREEQPIVSRDCGSDEHAGLSTALCAAPWIEPTCGYQSKHDAMIALPQVGASATVSSDDYGATDCPDHFVVDMTGTETTRWTKVTASSDFSNLLGGSCDDYELILEVEADDRGDSPVLCTTFPQCTLGKPLPLMHVTRKHGDRVRQRGAGCRFEASVILTDAARGYVGWASSGTHRAQVRATSVNRNTGATMPVTIRIDNDESDPTPPQHYLCCYVDHCCE
jgi:hypothetical protein